jgi:hypothetical protein
MAGRMTKYEKQPTLDTDKLKKLGLDVQEISRHHKRVLQALNGQIDLTIPIQDTCRLDNGGVLPLDALPTPAEKPSGFVAFVPAAGAASRYFASLAKLIAMLQQDEMVTLESLRMADLAPNLFANLALPEALKKLWEEGEAISSAQLLKVLEAPKGLQPATNQGTTFLDLKLIEHNKIEGLNGQVFVVPFGQTEMFQAALAAAPVKPSTPVTFREQDSRFSTIRFLDNGEPLVEDGNYSLVPGGHGTLIKLFPEVKEAFPYCHSVFIRNIDNAMGLSPEPLAATKSLLSLHHTLLGRMKVIRKALSQGNLNTAEESAKTLLNSFTVSCPDVAENFPSEVRSLGRLMFGIFQTRTSTWKCDQTDLAGCVRILKALYDLPLNTMGMVPNISKDVGGAPVYCDAGFGKQKLILELPHSSQADRKQFLEDFSLATHFNPVFACAEIGRDVADYQLDDSPFWILAKKTYHGRSVLYHETVLYELLGNSQLANTLFVEVPRAVFNPHKAVEDTRGKTDADWM